MANALSFAIAARSTTTRARLGRVSTIHGAFDTPAFMPVGTRGTVKGILPHLLEQTGAQICLGNTYHLMLRPGAETVARLGGLHAFMNWARPILTDSGGYQAYSMADLNKVTDDGVTFKSIIDGREIHMTPEESIKIQNLLGADIIMAFDDCPPPLSGVDATRTFEDSGPASRGTAQPAMDPRLARVIRRDTKSANEGASSESSGGGRRKKNFDPVARLKIANERTVKWLDRCKAAHQRSSDQSLFGIVQGGTDPDARAWSAERITNIDLPGYAIGGVAVGESPDDIAKVVRHTAPLLPEAKPRYLMGVGYERDLLAAVLAGVDMFDCVLPTRNGRNANAFTPSGQIRLRNSQYADDPAPIEPGCDCLACVGRAPGAATGQPFSRAYLRHLFIAGEMLGPILVTIHNLRYFQRFMADVRSTILTDRWSELVAKYPVAQPALIGLDIA